MKMMVPLQKQMLIADSVSHERFLIKFLCKIESFENIRKYTDTTSAKTEFERVGGNWIEHKVKRRKLNAKNELNWE